MTDTNTPESSFLLTAQPTLFTSTQCDSLGSRGITTVKQFLGLYHTPVGPEGLAALLQLDKEALEQLVQQSAELVGEEENTRLSTPVATPAMGLILDETPQQQSATATEQEEKP